MRAAFGVPLVPADENAGFALGGGERLEAEIAGGEVELLVVERVVGDVHLAVDPGERAVGFKDGGGVVIEAGGAALEEAGDDDDFFFARDLCEEVGGWAGDGLCGVEEGVLLALAEVLRAEKLWEADDVGAGACGFADEGCGLVARLSRVSTLQDIWMSAIFLWGMVTGLRSYVGIALKPGRDSAKLEEGLVVTSQGDLRRARGEAAAISGIRMKSLCREAHSLQRRCDLGRSARAGCRPGDCSALLIPVSTPGSSRSSFRSSSLRAISQMETGDTKRRFAAAAASIKGRAAALRLGSATPGSQTQV